MTGYHKSQAHLRRLYRAPDNSQQIIATCDKDYLPYLTYTAATHAVRVDPDGGAADATPRVSLSFPAIDVAWCPFKKGSDDAAFITASRDLPLQLWDVEDASLRASYVAANDSDYHVHAHAVCWFSDAAHSQWIAGGYGGFEDSTQVRVFDVVAEGSQPVWTYGAARRHGLVSSLLDCAWPGTTSLLAVGYHNAAVVHLIDCRHRCPAAELHGLRHGVQSLRVSSQDPFLIFGGGGQGDSQIACWDVRKPRAPLFTLARPVSTNQVFQFEVLPPSAESASASTRRLVSTTSAGGVLVYSWNAGEVPDSDSCVSVGSSVGPTSGLTVVDPDTVVVTTGSRDYLHRASDLRSGGCHAQRSTTSVGGRQAQEEGEEGGEEKEEEGPHFPHHKRARSPMTDASGSDSDDVSGGGDVETTEATNCAVIVLP